MKAFYTKVFDGTISGTANVYTNSDFAELLGGVERLGIGIQANAVSGSSPTITVQIENSPDGTRWLSQSTTAEYVSPILSIPDNAVQYTTNFRSTTIPIANYVRLRIAMGGTNPSAYVRLWVVGRSPAF